MSSATRASGFKVLRFAVSVALAGLGVAIFLVGGSYLYWQAEKNSSVVSQRGLSEQRSRVEAIKRERDDLQGSEETYKALLARGAFAPEQRLDLVEALDQLRKRHRLLKLEYDIYPQRPLKFATGANYPAVDIMASRIRMKINAYHDRDLLNFLDEFPRIQRGFFPLDRCSIKRAVEEQPPSPASDSETPALADANKPGASIEAECSLEWVTLKDKRAPASTPGLRTSVDESRSKGGVS